MLRQRIKTGDNNGRQIEKQKQQLGHARYKLKIKNHCLTKRPQHHHIHQEMKPAGMKKAVGNQPVQLPAMGNLPGIKPY